MRRLFIAVDLSIQVVERLATLQAELNATVADQWGEAVRLGTVKAPNIHLTLKFLGDTAPEMLPVIQETLRVLCRPLFPFEVECRGVGAFPELARAQILWAGVDETSAEVLGLLHRALQRDLVKIGVEKERRPFRPHVTLARVKSEESRSFEELLTPLEAVSFGKSFIKDLILFESRLEPSGARYEVVDRFSLGEN